MPGGTAGWLTAGIIAARHQARIKAGGFSVTLIESPDIKIIGVGEGTWPTMRSSLERMGVSETELFKQCDAAFKQGGKFAGWTTGAADDAYYHPLMLPQGFTQLNLVPHWMREAREQSFCDFVTPQGRLCDAGLAPKMITSPEYRGLANYAYHLDAGKFAPFLAKHCTEKLGVRHVLANVVQVNQNESGDIQSVLTPEAGEISAKLIAEQMPANREVMDIVAKRFNDVTLYRWGRIIDFLKLHYVLTRRTDTAFWRDNVDPASVPDRLKELLTLWKYHSPWFFDEFDRLEEVFPAASYQYVLYGMGFQTQVGPEDTVDTAPLASQLFKDNERMKAEMQARLPKNRELLNKIYEYGLQPV